MKMTTYASAVNLMVTSMTVVAARASRMGQRPNLVQSSPARRSQANSSDATSPSYMNVKSCTVANGIERYQPAEENRTPPRMRR